MPELPEVEVTRRGIAPQIQGARILRLRLGKPLRWPLGVAPTRLTGQTVHRVDRRGKYLLLMLDEGVLLVHLGMSGSLRFLEQAPPPSIHDHADLATSKGVLRLHDPRRFGAVVWSPALDAGPARKLLGRLGVEPLSDAFRPEAFHAALRRRRAAVKQVLLAGDTVVGVGNIYACEALFKAGIRPTLRADRISLPRARRLHAAIRQVLERAIVRGGSTLQDFTNVNGQSGYFQLEAAVYDREGLPCYVCGTPVRRIVQGQRSTYFCATCQRF